MSDIHYILHEILFHCLFIISLNLAGWMCNNANMKVAYPTALTNKGWHFLRITNNINRIKTIRDIKIFLQIIHSLSESLTDFVMMSENIFTEHSKRILHFIHTKCKITYRCEIMNPIISYSLQRKITHQVEINIKYRFALTQINCGASSESDFM